MRFINSLHEGEKISEVYLCRRKTMAVGKSGKEYCSLDLQDRTGTIDGKIWDLGSAGIREFDELNYVAVTADVTSFNGSLQLNIKEIRIADPGTYDEGDYLPVSQYDIEDMYKELLGFVDSIDNQYLSALAKMYFVEDKDFIEKFKKHSAAKRVHHGFVGGLLEHTLSVTRLCDKIAGNYSYLNRDLLITAAIFHDVGKVYELSDFPTNDYTDAGQLLGHIMMGSEMVGTSARKIQGFPTTLLHELKHCILAHHGELEYGSPKKPALAEAIALHYADDIDAKLETFKEAINAPGLKDGAWAGFNKMLDSNIRKTIG